MPRHTDLPDNVDDHKGERALAKFLDAIPDEQLHTWWSLDYVPGINDVDLLLAHEQVGIFVVEVKAVPLDAVTLYELDAFRIEGRPRSKTPLRQAKKARDQLANYLRQTMKRSPFLVAVACWPKITRREWNSRWPGEGLRQQAEGMIFSEDLTDRDRLLSRLAVIAARPGIGSAAPTRATLQRREIADLDSALRGRTDPGPPSKPTHTDHVRLHALEKGIAEDQRKQFADGRRHEVLFRGYPGTGKTFRLLQAGLQAARRGEDVLYVCFNKVLASDVARLVDLAGETFAGTMDCLHAFELVREYCGDLPKNQPEEDLDARAAAAVDGYTREAPPGHGFYQTVLVDEAQDLQEWTYTLVRSLAAPDASYFVAYGPGQALYRPNEAAWLRQFVKQAQDRKQIIQLKRNWRNPSLEFLTAQCFYETALRRGAIGRFLAEHGPQLNDDQQLQFDIDFDLGLGRPPNVRRVQTSAADRLDDESPFRATELRAAMEPALRHEITNALSAVRSTGSPSDVLVLVPSSGSQAAEWARAALRRVSSIADGVSYIDYTQGENRETLAQPDQIRLCTFHSSRGIEARRVIVVNFHQVSLLPAQVDRGLQNLGYIVLSRATEQTTIMVPAGVHNEALGFVEWVIAGVSQVAGSHGVNGGAARHVFRRGNRVNHQQHGVGRVVLVEDGRAWIDFGQGKPKPFDPNDETLQAI